MTVISFHPEINLLHGDLYSEKKLRVQLVSTSIYDVTLFTSDFDNYYDLMDNIVYRMTLACAGDANPPDFKWARSDDWLIRIYDDNGRSWKPVFSAGNTTNTPQWEMLWGLIGYQSKVWSLAISQEAQVSPQSLFWHDAYDIPTTDHNRNTDQSRGIHGDVAMTGFGTSKTVTFTVPTVPRERIHHYRQWFDAVTESKSTGKTFDVLEDDTVHGTYVMDPKSRKKDAVKWGYGNLVFDTIIQGVEI